MATVKLVLIVLVALMFGGYSSAMSLCNVTDDGLKACKPYVTPPGPVHDPSSLCCQALQGADLTCLCSYKNSFMLPSLGIDPKLAMALPPKCNLQMPPDC